MALRIASTNVNGIRAAVGRRNGRLGLSGWLEEAAPDLVCLQETRADAATVAELVGAPWSVTTSESPRPGRAGVAVATRVPHDEVVTELQAGRWVETTMALDDGRELVAVSVYVHTGQHDDPERMAEKLGFLQSGFERAAALDKAGALVVVAGDLNIAHRDIDLKNVAGNRGKAGCLPEERAWLDYLEGEGFVDIGRFCAPDDEHPPYTWWTYRGRAYDNDVGWRLDYIWTSRELADAVVGCAVHRAPSYETRWSDHCPVVADFDVTLAGP